MAEIVVIGVGNEYRRDDGLGLLVARRLRGQTPPGVTVLEKSGAGLALMDAWANAGRVILVDALSSGAEPGRIHRFEAGDRPLPAAMFGPSTHAFGINEALEMARQLDRLPGRVVVYGVEGGSFSTGLGLTPEVEAVVEVVVGRVLAKLWQWLG